MSANDLQRERLGSDTLSNPPFRRGINLVVRITSPVVRTTLSQTAGRWGESKLSNKRLQGPDPARQLEPLPGLLPRSELSQEECLPILAEAQAGNKAAVTLLIEHHLNLVIRLARRFRSDCHSLGDLVQFGLVGLLEAIEQYDSSRKNTFGQVANIRISQHVKRGLMRERRLISLPVRGRLVANKYRHWREQLDLEGVEVTVEDVMRELKVSAFIAAALLQCPHEVLYLNDLSGVEPQQPENTESSDRKIILEELLDRLTPSDRELVCDHFGINGDAHSARDLVRKYKISQGEVEERLAWALAQLREWSEAIGYDG